MLVSWWCCYQWVSSEKGFHTGNGYSVSFYSGQQKVCQKNAFSQPISRIALHDWPKEKIKITYKINNAYMEQSVGTRKGNLCGKRAAKRKPCLIIPFSERNRKCTTKSSIDSHVIISRALARSRMTKWRGGKRRSAWRLNDWLGKKVWSVPIGVTPKEEGNSDMHVLSVNIADRLGLWHRWRTSWSRCGRARSRCGRRSASRGLRYRRSRWKSTFCEGTVISRNSIDKSDAFLKIIFFHKWMIKFDGQMFREHQNSMAKDILPLDW